MQEELNCAQRKLTSEIEFDAWFNRYDHWREQTLNAIGDFGLAADYALFQNADAIGEYMESATDDWQLEIVRCDRVLHRHLVALSEILKSRPKLLL